MRRLLGLVVLTLALLAPAAAVGSAPPGLQAKLRQQRLQVHTALTVTHRLLLHCQSGAASTRGGVQPYFRVSCTEVETLQTKLYALLVRLRRTPVAVSVIQTLASRAQALDGG